MTTVLRSLKKVWRFCDIGDSVRDRAIPSNREKTITCSILPSAMAWIGLLGMILTRVSFRLGASMALKVAVATRSTPSRSEEHTSELQSRENLVCRLLLEKKKQPSYCLK